MAINRVVLVGRLTREPELRYTTNGVAVTTFTLAVDRPYVNQQGDRETDFVPVVTWRRLAETVAHHLSKGRLVAVDGRIQTRSYEDEHGQRRRIVDVVAESVRFLDRPNESASASAAPPAPEPETTPSSGHGDDLPF